MDRNDKKMAIICTIGAFVVGLIWGFALFHR